ncbi:MAG: hypothetical protein WA871_00800 [Candidatus Acidiferrales bacterium]
MEDALRKNMIVMIETIEGCLKEGHPLPGLVLLYTCLDVLGSVEAQPFTATRASFVKWADEYFLKTHPLPCDATELYAARCGILHTFTAISKLSQGGKARKIQYAWGNAEVADLAQTATMLGHTDVVTVHVRDLVDALRDGIVEYFQQVDADPTRQSVVAQRAGLWFTDLRIDIVRKFLDSRGPRHT